jgi:hypothetical protein
MTAYQHSDNRTDGQVLGQSAGDKVAFHGATPVCAATFADSAGAVGTARVQPISTSSGFTFANSSAGQAVINLVETMRTILIAKGLMKSS